MSFEENGRPLRTTVSTKSRTVFFALLGVAGLVLKRHYVGRYRDVVHDYGGNISASFAVYFVLSNLHLHAQSKYRRLWTAAAALLVVDLFEVTDGFGVMTNVYDPVDLVANAVGVALAWAVDAITPNGLPRFRTRDKEGPVSTGGST